MQHMVGKENIIVGHFSVIWLQKNDGGMPYTW